VPGIEGDVVIHGLSSIWKQTPPNLPLSGEEPLCSPPDKGEL
jgi:hypothetical protein